MNFVKLYLHGFINYTPFSLVMASSTLSQTFFFSSCIKDNMCYNFLFMSSSSSLETIYRQCNDLSLPYLIVFSLKDLGSMNYFLGVEAIWTTNGLFLSQHKYIRDLLEKNYMQNAKEVTKPLSTTETLTLLDGALSSDVSQYRQVVGAL